MPSHYLEMIEDALIQLSDRKGSSRQAIWKYINSKYPEADYKQFLIRLKKLTHEKSDIDQPSRGLYKLSQQRREKLRKALAKGSTAKPSVRKTKATMKKSKKNQKKRSSGTKGKRTSGKRKSTKGGKSKSGTAAKPRGGMKSGMKSSSNKKGKKMSGSR